MSGDLLASLGEGEAPASGHPACERFLDWSGSGPVCGKPALVVTRAMCIHEHLSESRICAGCLLEMRKLCDDSEWLCVPCWNGPDPHDCPMPMTVTALEPS